MIPPQEDATSKSQVPLDQLNWLGQATSGQVTSGQATSAHAAAGATRESASSDQNSHLSNTLQLLIRVAPALLADPEIARLLALHGRLERLQPGVTLFRQGDRGSHWYLVISGCLSAFCEDVVASGGVSDGASDVTPQTGTHSWLLHAGCSFGESILTNSARQYTVVTRLPCRLLRVARQHFVSIWQHNHNIFQQLFWSQKPTYNTDDWPLQDSPSQCDDFASGQQCHRSPSPLQWSRSTSAGGERLLSSDGVLTASRRREAGLVSRAVAASKQCVDARRFSVRRRRQLPSLPSSAPCTVASAVGCGFSSLTLVTPPASASSVDSATQRSNHRQELRGADCCQEPQSVVVAHKTTEPRMTSAQEVPALERHINDATNMVAQKLDDNYLRSKPITPDVVSADIRMNDNLVSSSESKRDYVESNMVLSPTEFQTTKSSIDKSEESERHFHTSNDEPHFKNVHVSPLSKPEEVTSAFLSPNNEKDCAHTCSQISEEQSVTVGSPVEVIQASSCSAVISPSTISLGVVTTITQVAPDISIKSSSTAQRRSMADNAGSSAEVDSNSSSNISHPTSSSPGNSTHGSSGAIVEDNSTLKSASGAAMVPRDPYCQDENQECTLIELKDQKIYSADDIPETTSANDMVDCCLDTVDSSGSSSEEVVTTSRSTAYHLMAETIFEPTEELFEAARALRQLITLRCPQLIKERRHQLRHQLHTHSRCMVGCQMVDWLLQLLGPARSRQLATGIWQLLLENGLILHVNRGHPFRDKYLYYRFCDDVDVFGAMCVTSERRRQLELHFPSTIHKLQQLASDALLRVILRKTPSQRTSEEVETVYEELVRNKALSHLSNSVRKELARVILLETHAKAGAVLFRQGEAGESWYIVLRGSVNVVIHGKGTVALLAEGDDFGNLALINDAPRAATIVCREDNCHFLRVDKEDFNRILRDVEANTVRLKEHEKDVLVLEKLPGLPSASNSKYCVLAGTAQKMLVHLLESRFSDDARSINNSSGLFITDVFLDDFLFTHVIFFPFKKLAEELLNIYRGVDAEAHNGQHVISCKKRVIRFLHCWVSTIRGPAFAEISNDNSGFLQELHHLVEADATVFGARFHEETNLMMGLMDMRDRASAERQTLGVCRWKLSSTCGNRITLFSGASTSEYGDGSHSRSIQPGDEVIFRVYCADHTFCTLKFPLSTRCAVIRRSAADKLGLNHEHLVMVELKSSGERQLIDDCCTSVPSGLSLNGRLFVISKDHLDALIPLPEQEGPGHMSSFDLEAFNSRDIAHVLNCLDWEAFRKIHEYELLHYVLGRQYAGCTRANLDVFVGCFNRYQQWVSTEICLCSSSGRRLALLRKFIKIADACREARNLNACFALVMGLTSAPVSRLGSTWDRLSTKLRRLSADMETLLDPARNHRAYRVYLATLLPPVIPLMPIIIKDMTFAHEGNQTYINGLVNFEKMHMLAQTMRTLRYCRSKMPDEQHEVFGKQEAEICRHLHSLHVIDNQKRLDNLSRKLESPR